MGTESPRTLMTPSTVCEAPASGRIVTARITSRTSDAGNAQRSPSSSQRRRSIGCSDTAIIWARSPARAYPSHGRETDHTTTDDS